MTKPTNYELFCYAATHPLTSPGKLVCPTGYSKEMEEVMSESVLEGRPVYLTNPIVKLALIILSYITIIPAIIFQIQSRFYIEKKYKIELEKSESNHNKAIHEKLVKAREPVLGKPSPNAGRLETNTQFLANLDANSFSGEEGLENLRKLGECIAFANLHTASSFEKYQNFIESVKEKTTSLVEEISAAISLTVMEEDDSESDILAFAKTLDKLRLLLQINPALVATEFIHVLNQTQIQMVGSLSTSLSVQPDGYSQFTYTGNGIEEGEARGSCGGCALAWLAPNPTQEEFEPIAVGHAIHLRSGLEAGEYADFATDIIGKNDGVSTDPAAYQASVEDVHSPVAERFERIIDGIENGTRGFLQVGLYFTAIRKNLDGTIEIYDSHGSGIGLGNEHPYAAYSARFDSAEKAAVFLSAHRTPEPPTENGQIEYHSIRFDSDITLANLISGQRSWKTRVWEYLQKGAAKAYSEASTAAVPLGVYALLATVFSATNDLFDDNPINANSSINS